MSSNYKPEAKRLFNFGDFDPDTPSSLKFTQAKLTETLSRLGVKKGTENTPSKMLAFLGDMKRKSLDEELDFKEDEDEEAGESSEEEDVDDEVQNPCLKGSGAMLESFTKLLTQIFDFKEQNSWLLENASLYLLDCFMGSKGNPETAVKESIMNLISEENLARFLRRFKDFLLNNFTTTSTTPSPKQQVPVSLKIDTKIKVLTAFSEVFAKKLGSEVTIRNLTLFLEMLQNETLNKHIIYTQLDSLIELLKNTL